MVRGGGKGGGGGGGGGGGVFFSPLKGKRPHPGKKGGGGKGEMSLPKEASILAANRIEELTFN